MIFKQIKEIIALIPTLKKAHDFGSTAFGDKEHSVHLHSDSHHAHIRPSSAGSQTTPTVIRSPFIYIMTCRFHRESPRSSDPLRTSAIISDKLNSERVV